MTTGLCAVRSTKLPDDSALRARIAPADFMDCFSVASSASARTAAETITAFPAWARFLLVIRKIVTVPFGLSQDGPEAEDKLGPFPVEKESADELIAGFNDRHLDFRVAVIARQGRVFLSTWVRPHNLGGRLYLRTIMPFHILIARDALARVAARYPAGS
ncbi:MAG: DUF2867 domain-containing protein [Pseudomonadota bacterium]